MGAEFVAFGGVEGALEEGAEDGGLDIAPVALGGFDEEFELVVGDGVGDAHIALVDVGVFGGVGRFRTRPGDAEDPAEFVDEELVIRALAAVFARPPRDEGVDGGGSGVGRWRCGRMDA